MEEARHKRQHIIGFYIYAVSQVGKSVETEGPLVVAKDYGIGECSVAMGLPLMVIKTFRD